MRLWNRSRRRRTGSRRITPVELERRKLRFAVIAALSNGLGPDDVRWIAELVIAQYGKVANDGVI